MVEVYEREIEEKNRIKGGDSIKTIQIKHPVSEVVWNEAEPCLIALGFFDGVHIGHRHLLQTAKKIAKRKKLTFAVMTFYPHPRQIVHRYPVPVKILTPLAVKAERLQSLGVEKLYVVKFDSGFARLCAEEFVKQYILGLKCRHIVAGYDFRYGYKAQGDMERLAQTGRGKFAVTTIPKITHDQKKISSTTIRHLMVSGKVDRIPQYLGDFHEVTGIVIAFTLFHGKYQFLKMVVDQDILLPKLGVYQIEVYIDKQGYKGVCHQILRLDEHSELLVQISGGLTVPAGKRIRLKWIQSFFGKATDKRDRYPYVAEKEFII